MKLLNNKNKEIVWEIDWWHKLIFNNDTIFFIEKRIRKLTESIYVMRLFLFLLIVSQKYIDFKYWEGTLETLLTNKYKDLDEFISTFLKLSKEKEINADISFSFNIWDIMELCSIKDKHNFNIILEETKNKIKNNINKDFSKKNTLYEDSLLKDYFIDMRDKTIQFNIDYKVLINYLYRLSVFWFQYVNFYDYYKASCYKSVNELLLYLNLYDKIKENKVMNNVSYSIELIKLLFKKEDYKNKFFVKFLSKIVRNLSKKNNIYFIDMEVYKIGKNYKWILFKLVMKPEMLIKKEEENERKKIRKVRKNKISKDNNITHSKIQYSEEIETNLPPISPSLYTTLDHHKVRSRAEAMIDDFLYHHNIMHSYEKRIIISWETIVCDFYLPQYDVYVEFWWMDNEKYLKRKEEKIKIYKENNLKLIWLENKDLNNLDESLLKKLKSLDK